MEIKKLQELIWKTYKHHDTRRGLKKTLEWFITEVYELNKAIEKSDKEEIKEEIADTLAWLASVANLLDIDIEDSFLRKYGDGCPKCRSSPCKCIYRDKPDKKVIIKLIDTS